MIISPDWIWLHFPKCAGSTIQRTLQGNFGHDPAIQFDPLDPKNVIWHQNVSERELHDPRFSLGDRRIICAIRRLPNWIVSRVHFELARTGKIVPSRDMLERGRFLNGSGIEVQADTLARKFVTPRVDQWIRVEHLDDDMKKAFGPALKPLTQRVNRTKIDYVKDPGFWFTAEQIDRLYAANPVWCELERQIYGGLLRV